MASRGRGRGRGVSRMPFTRDEMNSVGLGGRDAFQQAVTPPPLYPPFPNMPPPIESTDYLEYAYLLKQRYQSSNQSFNLSGQADNEQKNNFDWKMFPEELRPATKEGKKKPKVKKETNWRSALDKLDEEEQIKRSKVKTEVTANQEEEEKEVEEEENIEGDMDVGTDYVNNYFDNGDSNGNDEDDNMDEGPLY